jgi:myosin heavy subunit
MEVGSKVWAKATEPEVWLRSKVVSMEVVEPTAKEKRYCVKFGIQPENSAVSFSVTTFAEMGLREEFDLVKLRNASDDECPEAVEDLITLQQLHEPAILGCLEARFKRNVVYTSAGPILIAVNPFKSLGLYSVQSVTQYREHGESMAKMPDANKKLPPHVFQIADAAYRNMVRTAERESGAANQAILVSGESGAGTLY